MTYKYYDVRRDLYETCPDKKFKGSAYITHNFNKHRLNYPVNHKTLLPKPFF